jgi:sensor histidine kinase regulating citrate/malate metabolism
MLILVGIFLIDVLITYQTNKLAENNFKLSQLEVIKAQNNLQLAHYEETIIKYDESRKIIHDLRKHINVYADLKTKDEKAATEYACLIDQNINSLVGEFICTNRILSIIMDQKINQAKRDNIDIQLKFSDIPFDFLSDIDITALFANLWDNAIEGANTVTDGAKKIKIVIGEDKGLTVIVFENNYGGKVKRIKSGYLTTKAKGHQGLGLPIINTTVLKHDGHISVSNSDNIFKVSIMFTKENYPPRNNLFTISR